MQTLLIGLAGADWNVIDPLVQSGSMPFISSLLKTGVHTSCQALAPFDSFISKTTAITGTRPWQHGGIEDAALPKVTTLWDHVSTAGLNQLRIGWPESEIELSRRIIPESFFKNKSRSNPVFQNLEDLQVDSAKLDPAIIRWLCPALSGNTAARDPKAGRLAAALAELYSVHNTAASLLETETWDFASVNLSFLEAFTKDFVQHALAPQSVPRFELERYKGLHQRAYQLLDLLLSQLVMLVGVQHRVILFSPHAAGKLSSPGLILAAGSGLRRSHYSEPIGILDLLPTLLHLAELPVPDDLPGRIAADWFEVPPVIKPRSPIPVEPKLITDFATMTDPIAMCHLGIDLYECGAPGHALPALTHAHKMFPESAVTAFWLARCQASLGLFREAEQTSEIIHDSATDTEIAQYFFGVLALENHAPELALSLIRSAPSIPQSRFFEAAALLELSHSIEALNLIEQQLEKESSALIWYIYARCQMKFNFFELAAKSTRKAIELDPYFFPAWELLAGALAQYAPESEELEWVRCKGISTSINITKNSRNILNFNAVKIAAGEVKFTYREPGAEECARADAILGLRKPPDQAHWNRRVWLVDNPSRFIGSAIWRRGTSHSPATIHLKFQPRFLDHIVADRLLHALLLELENEGIDSAEFLLTTRDPWEQILKPHGYKWTGCDELWADIDPELARIRMRNSRLKGSPRLAGWESREIRDDDWPSIHRWCVDRGFHPVDRFTNLRKQLDIDCSGVVESANGLEGVLLATRSGMLQVIEFLAGNPDRPEQWPLVCWKLFERFCNPQGGPVSDTVAITTSPERGPFAQALAKRFGAKLFESIHRFVRV